MTSNYKAWLDDYNYIVFLIKKEISTSESFFLYHNKSNQPLTIINKIDLGNYYKYELSYKNDILLHEKYYIIVDNIKSLVWVGKITRSKRFSEEFAYKKLDLGVTYFKDSTTFKIWSPVAKRVYVVLLGDKNKYKIACKYSDLGVWSTKVDWDVSGYFYYLLVDINGTLKKINDPYATAKNSKFGVIIDFKTLPKITKRCDFNVDNDKIIIYETSIRDATSCLNTNTLSKYLKMLEGPIDYIKKLGVTHMQLLPVCEFTGLDKNNPNAYNWGYNPLSYFTLEGSYSTDENDALSSIIEFRQLVDYAHKSNIGVILDVVYNHVYSMKSFPFNFLVPGYYYRYDEKGIRTTYNGLDNELATERIMTRHHILQSVYHLVNTYKIDGFRFDLMGLLDIETMKQITSLLKNINPNILLYGEGWNMNPTMDKLLLHMGNASYADLGHFNDVFREKIFDFIIGNESFSNISYLLLGKLFDSHNKSINYLSCHDGYTLYDKLVVRKVNKTKIEDYILLSFALVLFSKGLSFIHGGDEFQRTKNGIINSYNKSDKINGYRWNLVDEHHNLINSIRTLIKISKSIMNNTSQIDVIDNHLAIKNNNKIYYIYFKNNEKNEVLNFDMECLYGNINSDNSCDKIGVYIFGGYYGSK